MLRILSSIGRIFAMQCASSGARLVLQPWQF
jgi:hypothetical protein